MPRKGLLDLSLSQPRSLLSISTKCLWQGLREKDIFARVEKRWRFSGRISQARPRSRSRRRTSRSYWWKAAAVLVRRRHPPWRFCLWRHPSRVTCLPFVTTRSPALEYSCYLRISDPCRARLGNCRVTVRVSVLFAQLLEQCLNPLTVSSCEIPGDRDLGRYAYHLTRSYNAEPLDVDGHYSARTKATRWNFRMPYTRSYKS